jgi:hypothetical protein
MNAPLLLMHIATLRVGIAWHDQQHRQSQCNHEQLWSAHDDKMGKRALWV